MLSQERGKLMRRFLTLGVLVLALVALSIPPAGRKARADYACCLACDPPLWQCQQNCVENFPYGSDPWNQGPGSWMQRCQNACDAQFNNCITNCGNCDE